MVVPAPRNGSIGGIGHLGGGGGPLSEAPGPRHFGRARAIGGTTREENIGGHQDRCGKIKPPASRGDTQRGQKPAVLDRPAPERRLTRRPPAPPSWPRGARSARPYP